MGIDVRIEDEHGDLWGPVDESTIPGNPNYLNWLLSCSDISSTICLKFIDPYGDTIFNQRQAKVLLLELAQAQERITEETISAVVAQKRIKLQGQGIEGSEGLWF